VISESQQGLCPNHWQFGCCRRNFGSELTNAPLASQALDEEGQLPERCWFTLFRLGARGDKSGYISDSGDHQISKDSTFRSPPLRPARYFLRMAGILRKPAVTNPFEEPHSILERCFDFLYPNVYYLAHATGFDIAAGEVISGLQVRIARPMRHTVRGKVIGDLLERHARISVMLAREIGAIDHLGKAECAHCPTGERRRVQMPTALDRYVKQGFASPMSGWSTKRKRVC
jgi:hypothetical protein